jgi:2-dehydropantoate 2-reductase
MKLLFFGAGVLGSLYAARLAETGHQVSILARGRRLHEIREQDIVLEHAFSGKKSIVSVNVVEKLNPSDHYDYIIVLVRKNQVKDVLEVIGKNNSTPNILVMVNNPSGYSQWADAIGNQRLMVGFAGAGGTLENGVVKYALAPGFFQPTTLAELNGRESTRLNEIVSIFSQAGFPTTTSSNMDAWQKTHVAWVSPLANAIYLAQKEGVPLGTSRKILGLTVDAIRESYRVLEELDVPVTPSMLKFWQILPKFLLVEILVAWTKTQHFQILILRHSLAARDEMIQIADEFATLAYSTGIPVRALDSLRL